MVNQDTLFKSELQLAQVRQTLQFACFGTRTQCSGDGLMVLRAPASAVGSRRGIKRSSSSRWTLQHGLSNAELLLAASARVQQVSVRAVLPVMQHNVVRKVRHNVTLFLRGPMQDLTYPTALVVKMGMV